MQDANSAAFDQNFNEMTQSEPESCYEEGSTDWETDPAWEAHRKSSHVPNAETARVLEEAEKGINVFYAKDYDDLIRQLNIDDL